MRYKYPLCFLLLAALTAARAQVASHAPTILAPSPAPAPAPSGKFALETLSATGKTVARVNGSVLTDVDLLREEYTIFPYARQHNGLPKAMAQQIREGAMKMIVFEELVYQEALRRKMTVPAPKIQRAENDFRKQFSTPEEFNNLFQSEFHGSEQLFKEKIRRSLLIDALLKSEIEDKGVAPPAEVRAYYDANPGRWEYPESYTFQSISILPPPKATATQLQEGRKRADDALRQAKATKAAEEFGLLAEKISDDDYRVVMGQHKPVPSGELAPQVLKALGSMKPGDVSDVIQVEQAFTIIRLNAHTPAGKKKFEEVKASLTKELQQKKTNQLRAALDKKLRADATIEEK